MTTTTITTTTITTTASPSPAPPALRAEFETAFAQLLADWDHHHRLRRAPEAAAIAELAASRMRLDESRWRTCRLGRQLERAHSD